MPFAVRMKAKLLLSNCPNYLISNNLHSPIYPQALKAEQLASTFAWKSFLFFSTAREFKEGRQDKQKKQVWRDLVELQIIEIYFIKNSLSTVAPSI